MVLLYFLIYPCCDLNVAEDLVNPPIIKRKIIPLLDEKSTSKSYLEGTIWRLYCQVYLKELEFIKICTGI